MLDLDAAALAHEDRPEPLHVDIDGFEGPLDLLLTLARQQKVDLREISILQLAEQYLAFIAAAHRLRLDIAADYLVAAAWLAYLKSRLLLPPDPQDEEAEDPEAMAAHLAFQLERLEAMRKAAARLFALDRLGRDVFARGDPESTVLDRNTEWSASLHDLLAAYARCKSRAAYRPLHCERPKVCAMEEALERLNAALDTRLEWSRLVDFLPPQWRTPDMVRSAVASTFAAMLELARNGGVTLKQDETFGPIYLRRQTGNAA